MNANQRKSVAIDSGSSTLLGSICVYLRWFAANAFFHGSSSIPPAQCYRKLRAPVLARLRLRPTRR